MKKKPKKAPRLKPRKTGLTARPVLRFSPTAWAKLLFFRDHQETEVGGFGLSTPEDLLFMEDFMTVGQEVTPVSVSFDDEAVADFFDQQVDAGRKPEQFARVWLHTHPGESPLPSGTDEKTFFRVFGGCQWAVMFILAQNGKTHARLRFNVGPGGEVTVPVEVDYSRAFGPSDQEAWGTEYQANIRIGSMNPIYRHPDTMNFGDGGFEDLESYEWLDDIETLNPAGQKLIIDRMAARYESLEEWEEVFDE